MKLLIFLVFLFCSIPALATTWYVRLDGGNQAQCTGTANAAYPGSGSAQPCAFNHPFWLLNQSASQSVWVWNIAGGDTVQFEDQGPYYMGQYNATTGLGTTWPYCTAHTTAACRLPIPPSGTSSNPTRILGVSAGACHTTDPNLTGSAALVTSWAGHGKLLNPTQLVAINGAYAILYLHAAQWVDTECLDITQATTCTRSGLSSYTGACQTGNDYATYGIQFANGIEQGPVNLTLRDIAIHGISATGIGGSYLNELSTDTSTLSDIYIIGNGSSGWNYDSGSCDFSCESTGTVNTSWMRGEWNGCVEVVPDGGSYGGNGFNYCTDDNFAGYGDGITEGPGGGAWSWDHLLVRYNTQDGFDGLHADLNNLGTLNLSNSWSEGNEGDMFKAGTFSTSHIWNNVAVSNCRVMGTASNFPNNPAGWNTHISDFCRGTYINVFYTFNGMGPMTVEFNTAVGYEYTSGWSFVCSDSATCTTTTQVIFRNNLSLGMIDPGTGSYLPDYIYGGTSSFANAGSAASNNLYYHAKTQGCPPLGSKESEYVCSDPLLGAESSPNAVNPILTSASPAIGAGIAIPGLTTDFSGNTRPDPPSIGALEYGSTPSEAQITVDAAPNPAILDEQVTLTATVAQTGSAVPTGSIDFMNGSDSLGQASLDSTGEATLVISTLPVGSYAVVAAYSGDSNYPSGESGVVPLQVLSATTTSLAASPNPVTSGQALTLTATVQGSGSTAPAGTVSFLNGSTPLGTATLNASGVATLSNSSLAAGTYSLTAQYSGNASFLSSTSAAVPVTVNAQATTTSLAASPNPVTAGQALALTATVQGSGSTAPAGTVSFLNGSTPLGTAALNASGVATLSTASLAAGTYSLAAQYSGNASFLSSTSAAVPVTVNAQATTTSLAASPNPVTAGQALALTATVTGSDATGTVTFLNGSAPLGTATLNASGVATFSTASLAAGTYSLTAQYTGNASFLSSTSAAVPVTVNAQATAIVESFSLNAGGSTSQTVQPGGTAVYTLGVSPAVGTTLPAINFVVSGLPEGATATFSPQTIPAGNGATNVTLSIQTSVQSAMLERNRKLGGGLVVALGILLLPFGSGIRRSGKRMLRLSYLVLLLAGAVSLAGLTGCAVLNAPGAFSSASAQTYTVTVTSAAASLSQTTTVTLIVE